MKGYKNSTKTVYETESSANYAKGGKAVAKTPMRKAEGGAVVDPGGYRIGGGRGTHRYAKDGDGWRMDASEFKVLKDITARDLADIEKGKRPGASKLDKMAAAEAERRQNRQGYASEGYDEDTGIGLMRKSRISDPAKRAASDAVRPKVYKAEGGAVKKAKTSDPFAREGIEHRLSYGDSQSYREAKPGTAQQVPAQEKALRYGSRVLDRYLSNTGGVAGGLPSKSAKSLKARAERYEKDGASASASAARIRASNVEGHEDMTRKAMKEIKRSQLKAKADAPGASFYDKARSAVAEKTGYAEGGKVKAPKAKPYDPVKDEPTSRPLTADQVRNIRNQMKAPKPPAKRAYDPVLDEPTSRAFKKGGYVKKQLGGLLAEREMAARGMVGKAKGGAASAVHKHERNMHPGKPLTKMQKGGKVGC